MTNACLKRNVVRIVLSMLAITASVGCNLDLGALLDELEDLEITINNAVTTIQVDDPLTTNLPSGFAGRGGAIILGNDVFVDDISDDLVFADLPDITLLGFENLTGFDIYIEYLVDGELQGVLVRDGETLLLEYFCLGLIELLTEEDFIPLTGEFFDEFDLSGTFFENPFDFECGDALIITIDPFSVGATVELIDLF